MRGEHVLGAALIVVGLFALYPRPELPFGTLREPGAGFFPVIVAAALILFAVFALASRSTETGDSDAQPRGFVRVSVIAAMIAGYALLLPVVGFLLCTVVLLVGVLRLGEVGWLPTVISSTAGATGCYLLFTRLGMPLPSGVLGF